MSLFGKQRRELFGASSAADLIPARTGGRKGAVAVTNDTALRHSAVWACLRLRADLVSTFPVDVYRKVNGIQVELPKPPILIDPGGEEWDYSDWMYASQFDLDRAGNAIGLITEINGAGRPARIDLQPIGLCSVIQRRGSTELRYRIDGVEYPSSTVWHERQYRVAGLPVGLSPVAYAAWSIGEYLSIQDFALDWFGGDAAPKARLKNTGKTIDGTEAEKVKERYRASVASGDIFVHGQDWEFNFMQAQNAGMEWIEGKRYGLADCARFFGAPADLIEAAVSAGGAITYASISQRNLQFLIMNLGPAVTRREKNLTKLMPPPRFVKLNPDALLRMDPETRARVLDTQIKSRTRTPNEARAYDNLPPLTDAQYAEFDRLFPPRAAAPQTVAKTLSQWLDEEAPRSPVPYDLQYPTTTPQEA